MLSLIPFPYRILALVVLVGAIFSYGLVKGLEIGQDRLEAFQEAQESIANKARVAGLERQVKYAANATESLNALQARVGILDAKYRGLRSSTRSGGVPSVPGAAQLPGAFTRDDLESYADARCLPVLEKADRELAKYVELWKLQQENSVPNSSASRAN